MYISIRIIPIIIIACIIMPVGHLFAQLSGTYTIDASKPATAFNYSNFNSAISDLEYGSRADLGQSNGKGVKGSVVFDVANGTYSGQFSINLIEGVSQSNTITFQSSSGDSSRVILVDSTAWGPANSNYLIYINAAKFISFKRLSFIRPNGGNVIYLSSTSHIHFENNIIAENDNFSSDVSDLDQHNEFDSFANNYFKNAGNGLYLSNIKGDTDSNFVIHNNIFENVINPIYGNKQTNITITDNRMSGSFNNSAIGISLHLLKGPALIKNNIINLSDTSGITGIFINSANLYLDPNNGPVHTRGKILIADNIIDLHDRSTRYDVRGMDVRADNFTDIVFNTVLIDSSTSSISFPLYFDVAGDTVRILNNAFINNTGKYAAKLNNTFFLSTDTLNYNDYYAKNGLILWNPVGKDTEIMSLDLLKTIDKKATNNISVLPLFKSPNDLHNISFDLHAKGISFNAVKDDIDGKIRNAHHPDIGATELTIKRDLGISSIRFMQGTNCNGITTYDTAVSIVTNNGIDTLQNVPFYYKIPHTPDSGLAFIDTNKIYPGNSDTIKIPIKLNVKDSGWYPIYVYLVLDSNQNTINNSTLTFIWFISAPKPSFTFSLACVSEPIALKINTKTDRNLNYEWNFGDGPPVFAKDTAHVYYNDSTHTIILKSIDSIGCTDTVSRQINPLPISYSTFSFQPTGSYYSFTPDDTSFIKYEWDFGDGDSSNQLNTTHTYKHNGIYAVTLYVENNNGCRDSLQELINIMDAGLKSNMKEINGLSIYPNPFSDFSTISYQLSAREHVQISLYDNLGKLVKILEDGSESEGNHSLLVDPNVNDLNHGIYFVMIKSGASITVKKIIYNK